ncbi:amino acid ABC transporter permease [Romboutsia lituseburensis]|uniref:Amino acid ABC transporter membrane protein, PAAT family n=3 Tax=Romboutsia lituseburensis TaxID=1537 RepID=A0A1G9M437_9FIRM|nr:amino acid ABC transporter permease [Romboutsia lituseburensis]SDL68697.1 amino acid ABC transporter membrane protein, PAAT family [Romboutsia lituseburensis DSM 797]
MLQGLSITISVFLMTLIISIPLGIFITFFRLSKNQLISRLAKTYILIIRGTPLLLQLIFIFFGLPLLGIVFDRYTAAIIAFSLNYAAYFAEIFRGGINTIDKGQYEGALVLGFSKFDMYKKIIVPQVIKNILPAMSNEIITLIKDTAIVYTIGLNDILRIAQIKQNQQASLIPLIQAGLVYIIIIAVLTQIFKQIEKRYSYYR